MGLGPDSAPWLQYSLHYTLHSNPNTPNPDRLGIFGEFSRNEDLTRNRRGISTIMSKLGKIVYTKVLFVAALRIRNRLYTTRLLVLLVGGDAAFRPPYCRYGLISISPKMCVLLVRDAEHKT